MKKSVLFIMALLASATVFAQVSQQGHIRKDGTYIAPTTRSNPNSTTADNYSTKGNYNPTSGKQGTRKP